VVSGKQVVADVGGNLNLQSLQDTSTFSGKQQNIGGSVTVGAGFSGSVSYSKSKAKGDFASVNEQTGIQAGDGGFQVNVKGNTDLKGAVIASNQTAIDNNRNSLTTGTLTHSDIENHSDYKASGVNLSGGYSQSMGGGKSAGSPNTVGQGTTWSAQQFGTGVQGAAAGVSSDSGNASSTTHSGISQGALTITDEAGQQQKTGQSASEAAASIQSNVLTGDGSNGLQKNWDGQKLLQEQAANAQIMATFGQQASKAAGTYADQQAIAARRADNEAEARKWDEGGEYRTALHAGIGALTGGVQGAVGAALSATALPEIGERIAALNLPDSVRDALNASIGAALGAVGGASGAAAGLNQAGNNYISHSPFRQVRQTVSQENARLLNACGANCTQADFLSIDQQVAQVERAANLAAIGQISSMTQRQAQELAQLILELAPFYNTGESALQLITGQSSITGEEASRFWAAIGVVPVAGGVLKKVGEPLAEAISQSFKKIASETKRGPNLGEYKGGNTIVDETSFYLRENELKPQKGNLIGFPEEPVKNASDEMIRSIKRQNEAGQILSNHGLSVEYLPNTGKPGPNPDLRINGQLADVYSPSGKNLKTIRDTVVLKSEIQAPNVIINLADSPLNLTEVAQYLQRNIVETARSVILIKDGKVITLSK
jgi:filamentous hemagglutinin